MDNLSIMVEAKKEYLGQLCLIMCPAMIEVFQEMYNESIKTSKGKQVLIMFQKLLKEVPNWSNAMSKRHSDNITSRCAWFGDFSPQYLSLVQRFSLQSASRLITRRFPSNFQLKRCSFKHVITTSRKICTKILTSSMRSKASTSAMKS